ncbi:hypothetical protein ACOMHN_049860 [Nucella lapillus]
MTLQTDHRCGLILTIVFVLLSRNLSGTVPFFPKYEQPSATAAWGDDPPLGSGIITTTMCENYDGKKECDPVTQECRAVMVVEKCSPPPPPRDGTSATPRGSTRRAGWSL